MSLWGKLLQVEGGVKVSVGSNERNLYPCQGYSTSVWRILEKQNEAFLPLCESGEAVVSAMPSAFNDLA